MDLIFGSTAAFAITAYTSGVIWILVLISAAFFFMVSEKWGTPNDVISVLYLLSLIPLVVFFFQFNNGLVGWVRIGAAAAGLVGLAIPTVGQTRLVLGQIDFEGSTRYFPGIAGVGLWLVMSNLAPAFRAFAPIAVVWSGVLAGMGMILTILFFILKQMEQALFYIGAALFVAGYPLWAFLLGNLLR